jgi:hypothetical protein
LGILAADPGRFAIEAVFSRDGLQPGLSTNPKSGLSDAEEKQLVRCNRFSARAVRQDRPAFTPSGANTNAKRGTLTYGMAGGVRICHAYLWDGGRGAALHGIGPAPGLRARPIDRTQGTIVARWSSGSGKWRNPTADFELGTRDPEDQFRNELRGKRGNGLRLAFGVSDDPHSAKCMWPQAPQAN